MKTIGILLSEYTSESKNTLLGIRADLLAFLRKYPVQVRCIPVSFETSIWNEFERVVEEIKLCDGIILPGGQDYYEIHLKIAEYLYNKNIPTLGICLGMQIMAVAFEGDLKRLECTKHQSQEEYVHPIQIHTKSKLFELLNSSNIMVNSRHSDAVSTTDLSISAIADDHTIEAVEDASKTFYVGVQWHPESLIEDVYSKKIFDAFISSL